MPSQFTLDNRRHKANTAAALQSGAFDNIGEAKKFAPKPLDFDQLTIILKKYGDLYLQGFAKELNGKNITAGGNLVDSLRFEFKTATNNFEVKIFMSSYAKFVDLGVQGMNPAKNKNTTSPFKFKFLHPSKNHVEALEKWIKDKNVTAIITVPKGIVSGKTAAKSLAYAIGLSTKQKGLKATYFKKTVHEKLIQDFRRDIKEAFANDLIFNAIY